MSKSLPRTFEQELRDALWSITGGYSPSATPYPVQYKKLLQAHQASLLQAKKELLDEIEAPSVSGMQSLDDILIEFASNYYVEVSRHKSGLKSGLLRGAVIEQARQAINRRFEEALGVKEEPYPHLPKTPEWKFKEPKIRNQLRAEIKQKWYGGSDE